MIPHTWQVFHTPSPDKHYRVLLEIMSDTWNIRGYLYTISQANPGNFAELGFFGVVVYTRTQTPRLWGQFCNAGVLDRLVIFFRLFRTSWLIVGIKTHSLLNK